MRGRETALSFFGVLLAIEGVWAEIPPVAITGNSPRFGVLLPSNTAFFKVGMTVVLNSNIRTSNYIVKYVNESEVWVSNSKGAFEDLSDFNPVNNGTISSPQQEKIIVPIQDQDKDRWEKAPTNADRNVLVDPWGEFYNENNRLPVDADVNIDGSFISYPKIINTPIANANTEVSIVIPQSAKTFMLKIRDGKSVAKISYIQNESNVNFFTIDYGNFYKETGLKLDSNLNVYVSVSKPNQTVEVLYWE